MGIYSQLLINLVEYGTEYIDFIHMYVIYIDLGMLIDMDMFFCVCIEKDAYKNLTLLM